MKRVFYANFGRENSLWPECLRRRTIATFNDEDLHPLWVARDRRAFIDHSVAHKKTVSGFVPTPAVASRWYSLMDVVTETADDLWIHREKERMWWTISKAEPASITHEPPFEPDSDGSHLYVAHKPCEPWSNLNRRGAPLLWSAIHPRAREFLFTEGTLQQLSLDNADYARVLIDGGDLRPWHERAGWRERADRAGRGATSTFTPLQRSIVRMATTAFATAANARGQEVTRTTKVKEVRMSQPELELELAQRWHSQEGLCALTGIPMQCEDGDDPALRCSLDRIDSDGHYEKGNLQIVCAFVNRWKSDARDDEFRRLLALVRAAVA